VHGPHGTMIPWRAKTRYRAPEKRHEAMRLFRAGAPFDWGLLALILVGMMYANIGTNFTNDYFDHKSGGQYARRGPGAQEGSGGAHGLLLHRPTAGVRLPRLG
jgi:hypothetical protein